MRLSANIFRHVLPSAAILSTLLVPTAVAQSPKTSGSAAGSLKLAISLPNAISNGVAIAPDGRTFLVIAKQKGQDVPQIAEYVNGELKPYPDTSWNGWKPGDDATQTFVHANSIRFGPDGTLWVVDFGSPEMGSPVVPHGPKLVGINIATGQVAKTYYLDKAVHPNSAVDDVRFGGDKAYLTDAGWPGLIVLEMPSGGMHRILSDQASTTALVPLRAEGHQLQGKDGKPIFFHADQIEVSPDGKWLYWQPCSGPMYALERQYVDDGTMSDADRVKHVKLFYKTGTSGGTAIDSKGNIYVGQTEDDRVLKITPDGKATTLVQDPRLVWTDAMWITADGRLWMPAAQMDRTPSFNDGKMAVEYPMQIFTVQIGDGPPRTDHK